MRVNSRSMAVASISALALFATACGGGGGSDEGGSGGAGGELTSGGCNPENPLVAGNTAETCGGDVLNVLTAQLIHYDSKTAEAELDIAESIETEDNQTFTVKLKDYKFHDGTDVKAHNFVDAWNYTAYAPNGQQGGYFFEPVEGYADLQCTGKDEEKPCEGSGKAKKKELAGLKVVDDSTFTIKTTEPVSNMEQRLGYTAFAPQPDAFFDDPEAFGQEPIAAGPYKFESWDKNKSIKLSKFADYSGEFAGKADDITFQIFQDKQAEYTALLAGEIDVMHEFPANAIAGQKFKQDLPDRNLSEDSSVFQFVGMNYHVDPKLKDIKVRQALSMAVDRETITKEIFDGLATPATGWVAPVVDGFKAGACGEFCEYSPEKAKQLLKEGGGYEGQLELTYNGDGGHKEWAEAVCNNIKNNLDVDCVATPTVDFATMLTALGEDELKGLFRMGWQMDYPSIENYLSPMYGKGASSNYYGYANDDFQKKMSEAGAADSPEAANKLYQEAEGLIADEFTTIPLWYRQTTIGWSEEVDNVEATPFGYPDLTQVTVNQ